MLRPHANACEQAGKLVDKLEGADSAALAQKLQRLIGSSGAAGGARQPAAPPASLQQPREVFPVLFRRYQALMLGSGRFHLKA